jgi:sucrose phosphorylase
MFMPGKPQVWYLDLFAGKNDHEAVKRAGEGGHKEINRTNLTWADIEAGLQKPVVKAQLELLRLRNTHPAFGFDAELALEKDGKILNFTWTKGEEKISLEADFETYDYVIR